MNQSTQKTVFITGASSGFGLLTARLFSDHGWNVVASMRNPDKTGELNDLKNVLVVKVDVTSKEMVEAAVWQAESHFGRIDVLINNAGYGAYGFFEEASEEEVHQQMDTNFFGVVNVSQAIIPLMRKQAQGVIINITSAAGIVAPPLLSLYSASKFAVEGLTESLNHELNAFGIQAKTVAPGAFKTGFGDAIHFTQGSAKAELDIARTTSLRFLKDMLEQPPKPFGYGEPQQVAETIYRAATDGKHKVRYMVGKDAKILSAMKHLLPQMSIFKTMHKSAMPQI